MFALALIDVCMALSRDSFVLSRRPILHGPQPTCSSCFFKLFCWVVWVVCGFLLVWLLFRLAVRLVGFGFIVARCVFCLVLCRRMWMVTEIGQVSALSRPFVEFPHDFGGCILWDPPTLHSYMQTSAVWFFFCRFLFFLVFSVQVEFTVCLWSRCGLCQELV